MSDVLAARQAGATASLRRPRVGFLGVGWIGRHRMQAMLEAEGIEAVAVSDPSDEMALAALEAAPGAIRAAGLDDLLGLGLDGLVIATPSAMHADQSIAALDKGVAVFCQKPLGRSQAEARAVVEAARRADRLLGVDLSYRFTSGARRIRELIANGELGQVFAADFVFHNAYGPDKPWFYDPKLSGGGCVMDLGVHMVDLALWWLGRPKVAEVSSRLLSGGRSLSGRSAAEDYAAATLTLEGGAVVRVACSWRLPAGREAVISGEVYGSEGGASLHNVAGSFYDFTAERFHGTSTEVLTQGPEPWGGRAAAEWARKLAAGGGFEPQAQELVDLAEVLDRIYAGA